MLINQRRTIQEIIELRRFGNCLIEKTIAINYTAIEAQLKDRKHFRGILEQENYIEDLYKEVLDKIIQKTFQKIHQELNPQVISIFLFSKEGCLKRYTTEGKDAQNRPLENTWLANESYKVGESFSGKAAQGTPYGEPNIDNNLNNIIDKLTYGEEYRKKLGFLNCGISVPLDSTHRTFGTLEVINRLDRESGLANENLEFSEEEVCWLTLLGGHLARAIYRIRKKQEERILTKITCLLVDPSDSRPSSEQVYKTITQLFINQLSPYKACILRSVEGDRLLVKETASTEDVNIASKSKSPRERGKGMVGKVWESGQHIIKHVDENPEEFMSRTWMKGESLKSFICFPLAIQGEVVGTLSLFTAYQHEFNLNEIDFLTNVSYLLSAYIVGLKKAMSNKTKPSFNRPALKQKQNPGLTKYIEEQANLFQAKITEFRSNPEYLGKYVLFENGKILDQDKDKLKLLKRTYDKLGNRPLFIEKIERQDPEPEIWDIRPL